MFRISLLWLYVAAMTLYAWRDWFAALLGTLLLMAVIEHPDMPKSIAGLQGLNPWNILMFSVLLAWLASRQRQGLLWDMPGAAVVLLGMYILVIVVSFTRMMLDRAHMPPESVEYYFSEHLVNALKWILPGILLYDGARTRGRVLAGLAAILAIYFLLAVQVIRWMPMSSAFSGEELTERARKIILNEVGYHSVNMSMMLSGASWAILACMPLVHKHRYKILVVLAFATVAYGQALTGGRMGYVTWGIVGILMCLIRWRRYLPVLIGLPLLIAFALPGTRERMLQGFGERNVAGQTVINDYEVTSGRTFAWPFVIEQIEKAPVWGHGKEAMVRTGLADHLWGLYRESFPHPHNAYLQMLLDNGLIGFVVVMPLFVAALYLSLRLFADRGSPLASAVGGVSTALLLALLVASMGSQTFYPREGAVGMWAAMGLMLRVHVERARVLAASTQLRREMALQAPAAREAPVTA